jgi:hypothetical protein
VYNTSDLYLASALQQAGHSLKSVVKDSARATFEFEDSEPLREAVSDFFAGRLVVEAHGFAERIRSAKSMAINAPMRSRS